jgi:RNA polymerase sigma-70 factor (ECF subfamily)
LAYRRDVDAAPPQAVNEPLRADTSAATVALQPALLDQLWGECGAPSWGLLRSDFDRIILLAATRQNFGLTAGAIAGAQEQAAFFRATKLADLVLAAACAEGNERAWEHFMEVYGAQLTRAAIAISGSETVGRDLADAFYAELYGLNTREGQRKCPLESYRGHGSLLGWLRTTLSQRFVDHYRRTFREEALDEDYHDAATVADLPQLDTAIGETLRTAIQEVLSNQPAEERFMLAAYYLDGQTLAEIGQLLRVHEATVSRRLKRATESVRKGLVKNLEKKGMSRRAAEEALRTDPRDLELGTDLKKLLQHSTAQTFPEQAIPDSAAALETVTAAMLSNTQGSLATEANGEE